MDSPLISNPLIDRLRRSIPGETFRLPSQALFYTDGELDETVVNGEVHVLPLSAMDEVVLKSPDMLMSGKAYETVFARCIPQIKKPLKLLAKDIDFLLLCLRILSYGPTSTLHFTHNCDGAKSHEYEVELRALVAKAMPIDPTTLVDTYTVTLTNGQVVRMRPAVFGSVLEMYQSFALSDGTDNEMVAVRKQLIEVVGDMILDVDGIDDRQLIRSWLIELTPDLLNQLSDASERISHWGPDLQIELTCKDCGEICSAELPINPVSFFT